MGTVYTLVKSGRHTWEALSLCAAEGGSETHL